MINNLFIFVGDVGDLGLYFASDEQEFGKIVTYDLKYVRESRTIICAHCV